MKFGLIGFNISHSKSPKLHNIIAQIYNRKIEYDLISLNDETLIKTKIEELKNGIYQGFNVTIPYKETVIKYIDKLTDKAKKIKAVNTIYLEDGLVIGDNTDYDGFLELLNQSHININTDKFIILGSGGASKAVYHVLNDLGNKPVIVSRSNENEYYKEVITYSELDKDSYNVIVNTTPLGMYPNISFTPLEKEKVQNKKVIDLIYNPNKTLLMEHAKESFNGKIMLIVQAIKAQNIWFNETKEINRSLIDEIVGKFNE